MSARRSVLLMLLALVWAAPLWAQPPAGVIEYYHVDALGSVRAVTNASDGTVRTHHYHPFGEGVGVDATTDPMRFTGKPRDGETGLDYFGARYFAPKTGRFTSVDPIMNIAAAMVDPQRWGRYAYSRNNPSRYVDPDGRDIRLAVPQAWLDSAKSARESLSKSLGGGLIARIVDQFVSPMLPSNPREVADSVMGSAAPAAMAFGASQIHHIATNKSIASGWTAQYAQVFSKAGMTLDDAANKMVLTGHSGPHTEAYKQYVLTTLQNAVEGLSGADYKRALLEALDGLKKELAENPDLIRRK